jgi:hypothetical protein
MFQIVSPINILIINIQGSLKKKNDIDTSIHIVF